MREQEVCVFSDGCGQAQKGGVASRTELTFPAGADWRSTSHQAAYCPFVELEFWVCSLTGSNRADASNTTAAAAPIGGACAAPSALQPRF
eukprot:3126116-Amphidinium_carterae.1